MRTTRVWALLTLMASSPAILARRRFDGTRRPDPQRPTPDAKPDVLTLSNGNYECQSCQPPYRVPADGQDRAVSGNPRFDTLAISVVDGRTVLRTARRDGVVVVDARTVVAVDGNSKAETQTVTGVGPRPFEFSATSTRVTPAAAGSHALSGSWRVLEMDLVNHDEDTAYQVTDGARERNVAVSRRRNHCPAEVVAIRSNQSVAMTSQPRALRHH